MVQAILLMLIYIFLPIYLTLSNYDVEAVFQIAFVMLGVKYFTAVWAMANYLDDSLFISMYPDATLLGTVFTADVKRLILDVVTTLLYIVGPIVLLAIMSAAGQRAGAAIGGAANMMTMSAGGMSPRPKLKMK